MTHSDTPSESLTFGMRLRAKRESRQFSLEEIGSRLRLNPDIIQTLESGNYQNAPPAIFMRGYLRSYAKLLGFTDHDIQHALTESGLVVNTGTPLTPRLQGSPERAPFAPWLRWMSAAVAVTLALGVFVWWNAYPVTLVRDALSAHLPLPSATPVAAEPSSASNEPAEVTASNEPAEVAASNDVPAETIMPAVPEAPLVIPGSIDIDPGTMQTQEQADTDPA